MATNFFFDQFDNFGEQDLLEDLIVESIQIYGHDVYYLPYTLINKDDVYGEDDVSQYNKAIMIEMYIKNVEGFSGENNFLSFAGLEIRDSVTFTVAQRTFDNEIGTPEDLIRPRERDLIYFPLNKKCFQIRYVDNKPFFYQLGKLQTYDLQCSLFEYSHEQFNTGIAEIDDIQTKLSINILDHALTDELGNAIQTESGDFIVTDNFDIENYDPFADNSDIQTEADNILDFSETDPLVGDDGTY